MNNRRPAFHVKKLFIYVYFRKSNVFSTLFPAFTTLTPSHSIINNLFKTLPSLALSIINNPP